MSFAAVADTHAALWYLYADPRLSLPAKAFIDQASAEGNLIAVSSISLIEVVYLIEKGRIQSSAYEFLREVLTDPERHFQEIEVSQQVSDALRKVSRSDVPDMPDRIVAATAMYLNVPIITRDRLIRTSTLATIW
jgi:PIN domain nuclease of toxin-antitoxin system